MLARLRLPPRTRASQPAPRRWARIAEYWSRKLPLVLDIAVRPDWQRLLVVSELARRMRYKTQVEVIPLARVDMLHPVTRHPTAKMQERIHRLKAAAPKLRHPRYPNVVLLTRAQADEIIPSIDQIQVVRDPRTGRYITLQGVGRLTALRAAFGDSAHVEVEVSDVRGRVLKELRAVRRMYKLEKKNELPLPPAF